MSFKDELQKYANFGKAVTRRTERVVKGEPVNVSDEVADSRWETCKLCENFTDKKNGRAFCKHPKCGCNLEKKVRWASESCPIGKWQVPDLVSVSICHFEEQYLEKTIKSLKQNAHGPIELLISEDKDKEGQRVLHNRNVMRARGKYIYFVDAHCDVTSGWDLILKERCEPNTLVFSTIDSLEPVSWKSKGKLFNFVSLSPEFRTKWWNNYHGFTMLKPTESMGFTGCGWMVQREDFMRLKMFDENLGPWGQIGSEWSLKYWLSGGKVLFIPDVICSHWFRSGTKGTVTGRDYYKGKDRYRENYKMLQEQFWNGNGPHQIHDPAWLVGKFWPVPRWEKTLGERHNPAERVEWISVNYT